MLGCYSFGLFLKILNSYVKFCAYLMGKAECFREHHGILSRYQKSDFMDLFSTLM